MNIKINGTDQSPRKRITVFPFLRKDINESMSGTLDINTGGDSKIVLHHPDGHTFSIGTVDSSELADNNGMAVILKNEHCGSTIFANEGYNDFIWKIANTNTNYELMRVNYNGNLIVNQSINASGNITASYFIGNGSLLTGLNFYNQLNPSNFLNSTTISNSTIARTGNCPAGSIVQNTTTSGVQCTLGGSGTVTSITAGSGLSGGTITSSGTIALTGIAMIKKTINETRVNTATLANDAELNFTVAGNTYYWFKIYILFTTNAAPDIQYTVANSGADILAASYRSYRKNAGTTFSDGTFQTSLGNAESLTAASTGQGFIIIEGFVITGSTGGSITFQWAQDTSNAAATTVNKGSYILYGIS